VSVKESQVLDDGSRFAGASTAVLLGSGLGGVCDGFRADARIRFADIPGVSRPGVTGHDGAVIRCMVGDRACMLVRGRKHHYEGKTAEISRLISFVRSHGAQKMLVTSAGGSLDRNISPGQLTVVERVIDFQHRPPTLSGSLGPRSPGISRPAEARRALELDPGLTGILTRSAVSTGISLTPVTLARCSGPAYETRAEVRALQNMGASVVSMSVAPEVAIANSLGIQVACVVVATNWVTGISDQPLSHAGVLETGRSVTPGLRQLIAQFVSVV
jgi:purine-nucleoside phosphorylase